MVRREAIGLDDSRVCQFRVVSGPVAKSPHGVPPLLSARLPSSQDLRGRCDPMSFAEHPDFAAALALAARLTDVARRVARQHFRTPVEVVRKPDGTPVTLADRGIEDQMRGLIRAAFPAHAIRGEEFLKWYVDRVVSAGAKVRPTR